MRSLLAAALIGYLLGSIPSGLIVARRRAGIDLREHGSGNPGGTNAIRLLGWVPGMLVIVADAFKGFGAVWLARSVLPVQGVAAPVLALVAGTFAVLGHVFPAFSGLRGGKGVAPAAGVLLGVHPPAFLLFAAVFVGTLSVTRIASVASLAAGLALPIGGVASRWIGGRDVPTEWIVLAFGLAAFLLVTHRANIARLLAGAEPALRATPRAGAGLDTDEPHRPDAP